LTSQFLMASLSCSFISLLLVLRPGAWRRFTLSMLSLTNKSNPRPCTVSLRSLNFPRRLKSQFLLLFTSFESRTHTTDLHDHWQCSTVRSAVSANKSQISARRIPSGKTPAICSGYPVSFCLDVLVQESPTNAVQPESIARLLRRKQPNTAAQSRLHPTVQQIPQGQISKSTYDLQRRSRVCRGFSP
jgi:hypothetical protein